MSANLDRALMGMSLEEEDEAPFIMPDMPQFDSSERNVMSLVGRALNPKCTNIEHLVRDLPRKWQIYERVRGMALSQERFQFIFENEHELEAILKKGVHTFNEWTLAIERWVENPPDDYLMFIPVWVRIRNIPMNHYTVQAITALGEIVGQVLQVAFDSDKSQDKDYVRVQVRFDVSKSVRRSKLVHFKEGPVNIFYDFEKIQKRCFSCQRLSHERDLCPFRALSHQKLSSGEKTGRTTGVTVTEKFIKDSDPLLGVVEEDQVGIDPLTGRQRIAKEVLDHMRSYLLGAEGAERLVKEARIKSSLLELKNDPIGAKSILRLEPLPVISSDINKGKGFVFDYGMAYDHQHSNTSSSPVDKLMGSAIQAGLSSRLNPLVDHMQAECESVVSLPLTPFLHQSSTVFSSGLSEAGTSGTLLKNGKPRKRPYKSIRRKGAPTVHSKDQEKMLEKEVSVPKRKATDEAEVPSKVAKCNNNEVVPKEGPSNQ